MNRFVERDEEPPSDILRIPISARDAQTAKLKQLRGTRSGDRVQASLHALTRAAENSTNTMPFILDAVRNYATLGEICGALRTIFGVHQEQSIL